MTHLQITSLRDPNDHFEMYQHPGHDMWVNTLHVDMNDRQTLAVGREVRIYSHAGSPLFGDLHAQLLKTFAFRETLNDIAPVSTPAPDWPLLDQIHLIDAVADQSVLTLYYNQLGDLGIQSSQYKRTQEAGPIVALCAPLDEHSTPAEHQRAELFLPLVGVVQHVASRFNPPDLR